MQCKCAADMEKEITFRPGELSGEIYDAKFKILCRHCLFTVEVPLDSEKIWGVIFDQEKTKEFADRITNFLNELPSDQWEAFNIAEWIKKNWEGDFHL